MSDPSKTIPYDKNQHKLNEGELKEQESDQLNNS